MHPRLDGAERDAEPGGDLGRGLEVALELEEQSLRGPKAFLLGAALEQFFARYVTLNSFTETVVSTLERGEIMRWPTRLGSRHLL